MIYGDNRIFFCIFAAMDVHTPLQRHKNMAAVRSKNTKPEIIVRHYLWRQGFRYRLNDPRLPGHPDIVLRKYRTCVFVNGCFWHGHEGCKYAHLPQTHAEFWLQKITRNKERDKDEQRKLHIFHRKMSLSSLKEFRISLCLSRTILPLFKQ